MENWLTVEREVCGKVTGPFPERELGDESAGRTQWMREEVAIILSIKQQQQQNMQREKENLRTLPLTSPTDGYL